MPIDAEVLRKILVACGVDEEVALITIVQMGWKVPQPTLCPVCRRVNGDACTDADCCPEVRHCHHYHQEATPDPTSGKSTPE